MRPIIENINDTNIKPLISICLYNKEKRIVLTIKPVDPKAINFAFSCVYKSLSESQKECIYASIVPDENVAAMASIIVSKRKNVTPKPIKNINLHKQSNI